MKAILVRHPVHTSLETALESWQQGDVIKGQLTYKNESSERQQLSGEVAAIYAATIKEVREGKIPEGQPFFQVDLPQTLVLSPNEEKIFSYEFKLSTDAYITDKSSGLFFYFGNSQNKLSSLALNIIPHQRIQELLQNVELFLRFKTKSIKAKKDKIEIKIQPPPSKEYASLEAVTLLTKFIEENIQIEYLLKVKKLDYSSANLTMTPSFEKGVVKKKTVLTPSDYLIFGKAFHGEKVAALVDGAFEEVKTKSII